MGLNANLAIANRMRAEARLISVQIKDNEKFIKDEFLIDVKWIWLNTKTSLINSGIKTISDLKKWEYKNIWLSIISVLALDRFLDKLKKEETENEIETKIEEAINWNIDENVTVIELEEDLFDKQ